MGHATRLHALVVRERCSPMEANFFSAFGHLEGPSTFVKGRVVADLSYQFAAGGSHEQVRQAA
jgi:hypothetical protein